MMCPTCIRRDNTPVNNALPPHPCPFKSDVCDDDKTLCECCDDCTQECADDI